LAGEPPGSFDRHRISMTAKSQSGAGQATDYYYRRALTLPELLPALGVAVGAGLAAFYVARLFTQRTPLVAMRDIPTVGPVSEQQQSSPREAPLPRRRSLVSQPTITRRAVRRADAG
jgi:hypothetical protein